MNDNPDPEKILINLEVYDGMYINELHAVPQYPIIKDYMHD